MKTLLLLLLLSLLAGAAPLTAQPHIVGVSTPYTLDGRTYVIVYATQLAEHSVEIEFAPAPNFAQPFTGAAWACYPERQVVIASFPTDFYPENFYRARNNPCNGNGNALADFIVGPLPVMNAFEKAYRFTVAGVVYRLEPLPMALDGARRFVGTPVEAPAPPPPPVVAPLRVTDDGLTAQGQRQRTCLYHLDRGRFYELQTSADGGATWSHRYVSCNQPEPLIQPGAGNIGNCGGEWWFITDTTSGPGYVLARFVDWTAANPRPGPFWKQ